MKMKIVYCDGGKLFSITHDTAYYLLFIMLLCSNEDEVNRKDRQKRKRKLPVESQEGVVVVSYDSSHSDTVLCDIFVA